MYRFTAVVAIFATWGLATSALAATEINANVISVEGKTVRATVESEFVPATGDHAEIFFTVPELAGERVFVAAGRVTDVKEDHIELTIDQSSGQVLRDYLVRITSENPQKKDAALKVVTNSLGMKLVRIAAAEFIMGSPPSEASGDTERQHPVKISRPFYLGACEVTVGEFRRFVEATGYQTTAEKDGHGSHGYDTAKRELRYGAEYNWRNPGFPQTEEHPVVCVSWDDAVAFCQWLSRTEQKDYRLPTEAEWELACRAGTTTAWTSGGDGLGLRGTANIADASLRSVVNEKQTLQMFFEAVINWNDGFAFTAPAGRFPPNAFGLYDMDGNVREHCHDWFEFPYSDRSLVTDPQGPSTSIYGHVERGGAWSFGPSVARCASRARLWEHPSRCYCDTGFRVALAIVKKR